MHKASYFEKTNDDIKCLLCPRKCSIYEGQAGFCRVRKNVGGVLYSENYALCSAAALDPIEKKPLYHFYPGASILSIGTRGCNFTCSFCQNWAISQENPRLINLSADEVVRLALEEKESIGIAYTYSEPTVWFEYVLETEKLAKKKKLKNVVITNGFINPAPLDELLAYTDAFNIDLKAFSPEFYQQVCSGRLEPVLDNIKKIAEHCHVEITTLLIPGLNDSKEEIGALADWLATINPEIPLHLTRYFPNYKLNLAPTPLETLQTAREAAAGYLHYVYVGNVAGEGITYCPHCKAVVIDRGKRRNYLTSDKTCRICGSRINIAGEIYFANDNE